MAVGLGGFLISFLLYAIGLLRLGFLGLFSLVLLGFLCGITVGFLCFVTIGCLLLGLGFLSLLLGGGLLCLFYLLSLGLRDFLGDLRGGGTVVMEIVLSKVIIDRNES